MPPGSSQSSGTKKVLLVGGALGCGGCALAVLLGVGALGGGWAWLVESTEGPIEDAATAFLADIRAGNAEAAWARTDPRFRATRTLDSFRATIAATPALTTQTGVEISAVDQVDGIEDVRGTLETPIGPVDFTIQLFDEAVTDVWVGGQKLR